MEIATAFLAAALTVALSEWAARCRHRREKVEVAALELPMAMPRLLVGLGDPNDGYEIIDTSTGSDWDCLKEKVLVLQTTVRVLARWPMLRAKRIRETVERESAQLAAAEIDFRVNGRRLSKKDIYKRMSSDLNEAVFGKHSKLDVLIEHFRQT